MFFWFIGVVFVFVFGCVFLFEVFIVVSELVYVLSFNICYGFVDDGLNLWLFWCEFVFDVIE